MDTATYIYCLVQRARKPSAQRAPRGLPGATAPAAAEAEERLWIVHADVPIDQYGAGPLEASLKDLDWVSRIAVAHEAIVEHFTALPGATVIPMKLFTMFSSLDRAVAEMRERSRELKAVFRRLEGCEEWGVRVLRGQTTPKQVPAKPSTGTAFLAARKQARDDARAATLAAASAAEAMYHSLAGLSADHRRRATEAPGAVAPLLDAAFLVPTRQRARFQSAAKKLAKNVSQIGAQMTLTGPWPPYNFVRSLEDTQ
jgi:hypothetical protein